MQTKIKVWSLDYFEEYLSNFFFYSVLCPFQDYFTHRDEPIDRWGETGVPRENHLTHPQAELVSHVASAGLEPTPGTAVR